MAIRSMRRSIRWFGRLHRAASPFDRFDSAQPVRRSVGAQLGVSDAHDKHHVRPPPERRRRNPGTFGRPALELCRSLARHDAQNRILSRRCSRVAAPFRASKRIQADSSPGQQFRSDVALQFALRRLLLFRRRRLQAGHRTKSLADWRAFFEEQARRGVTFASLAGAEPALEQDRLRDRKPIDSTRGHLHQRNDPDQTFDQVHHRHFDLGRRRDERELPRRRGVLEGIANAQRRFPRPRPLHGAREEHRSDPAGDAHRGRPWHKTVLQLLLPHRELPREARRECRTRRRILSPEQPKRQLPFDAGRASACARRHRRRHRPASRDGLPYPCVQPHEHRPRPVSTTSTGTPASPRIAGAGISSGINLTVST